MAAISVNDGGTWRTPYSVHVNDGGTWRNIQQIYVNDGGTWKTAFTYSLLSTTMTEGAWDDGVDEELGYSLSRGFGSLSASTLTSGYLVRAVYDSGPIGVANQANLLIGGFGSDPGATAVFSSIEVNGVVRTAASATYLWIGAFGYGSWYWPGSPFGLDGASTSTVVISP